MSPLMRCLTTFRPSLPIHRRPDIARYFTHSTQYGAAHLLSAERFIDSATRPSSRLQIYISRSLDPFLNLSIEHYLLQHSPPNSTVLFLYTDRPCVVLGRNQNPWLEVNLSALKRASLGSIENEVLLVRRRSGGGTVFHDAGNVNYSVICPTSVFHRDKHAQMVVDALQSLGVSSTRVNARHDIVMDSPSSAPNQPLKVSGSAYKLTRLRSLHHGTCLLSSPNLKTMSLFLRSPAKPYIKARGVESVSSPVGNVGVTNDAFEEAVVRQFGKVYDCTANDGIMSALQGGQSYEQQGVVAGLVGDAQAEIADIAKGVAELKSDAWKYLQTPQFTFSNLHDGQVEPSHLPEHLPPSTRIFLQARSGVLFDSFITTSDDATLAEVQGEVSRQWLADRKFHEITSWSDLLMNRSVFEETPDQLTTLSRWLHSLFDR